MNLTVKRCLLGLIASATMFGISRAQDDEPVGTVQLGPQGQAPVVGQPMAPMESEFVPPPGLQAFPTAPSQPPVMNNSPAPVQPGNYFRVSPVDQVLAPRFVVDSRGGGLYGYGAGYSNIGVFAPYKLDDTAIVFATGLGLVDYTGKGGGTGGVGWRYYMEDLDRIIGLAGFFDYDSGHAQAFQQVGFSFESLGRYVDYRINGYVPVSKPDHVLSTNLTSTSALVGNGIGLLRNNTIEQAYSGFDAELGGPTPILGRYGLNAYIGGYSFSGDGVHGGNFQGVSGRLLSQINEDLSFGVQVTNDHVFGLNTQFQVFAALPSGRPSRWLRNLRVQDRMVQNVFRQNRVIAHTDTFNSFDTAINPKTNQPYFVASINPNQATNGDGSATNPFNSIKAYESLSLAQRQRYDIILVQPNTGVANTRLDTSSTLDIYNGQRLLSTSIAQTFTTANFPGLTITLPGTTGGAAPVLFNSSGGDVVTLIGGNTQCQQVSGFEIVGSKTGNGIRGNNNSFVSITDNNIHGGLNGVLLTNLSGTIAAGTEAQILRNNIHDNLGNGFQITNHGSPPAVNPLDVVVQGNTFNKNAADGLLIDAQAGSQISGIIGGPNTAATATTAAITRANTFSNNAFNGLDLRANGGTLNFAPPAVTSTQTALFGVANNAFGIYNNAFTTNTLDGLHIDTTNNSLSNFLVVNNTFGTTGLATSGNLRYGIGLTSDSGSTTITIGGAITTNPLTGISTNPGNTFNFNAISAINLAVSGTGTLNYNINNNTISNGLATTTPAPHDSFTFTFDGTSGTDPFVITNTSPTAGVSISSVVWDLTGTAATIAPTTAAAGRNPVVLQPVNDLLLNSLNNLPAVTGSNPLNVVIAGVPSVANNANSGLAAGSQLIPMGFTNFSQNSVFKAKSLFEDTGGSAALTSAAANNSSVTVTFRNPDGSSLVSTQKLTLQSAVSPIAIGTSGDVFGNSIPGFGTGSDGIHVAASGSSTLNTAVIQNNTVSGYGGYGIHVETSNSARAADVIIERNTLTSNGIGVNGAGVSVFSGGALNVSRHDSSFLDTLIDNNTITSNFNNGFVVTADGTATGSLNVTSHDNNSTSNAGNGLSITSGGAAKLNFNSNRDNFNGNGSGSARNAATSGGDNMTITTDGTSVSNVNFHNVLANSSSGSGLSSAGVATGSGLSSSTNGSSILNLIIDSPVDPLFTGTGSSFSNNKLNGMLLGSNDTSYLHLGIYQTTVNSNLRDGIAFNRTGASLVQGTIQQTSMNSNARNGFNFQGLGGDPTDPTQQLTGTPNTISLIHDTLNSNGTIVNGNLTGDGAHANLFGQSTLVLNALGTQFENNIANGVRVDLSPGASFGYFGGNIRSNFDNVTITGNGANGIMFTSVNSNNPIGDAESRTFFNLNSVDGNSVVSNNKANGILAQYPGGTHDIEILGDGRATPTFGTFIQSNAVDGIREQIGAFATSTLTVDTVLIGGPNAADANKGDGINFQATSLFTIQDSQTGNNRIWNFNTAGVGTLNVHNTTIQNNGQDGISLLGNALSAINGSNQTRNDLADAWGQLNANVTNSNIINNVLNGITVELEGRMGGDRYGFLGPFQVANSLIFRNNYIANNGHNGFFLEQNAGEQVRPAGFLYRRDQFINGPTTPPTIPLDFRNYVLTQPFAYNNGENVTNLVGAGLLSDWMNLATVQDTALVMTGNRILYNGNQPNITLGDGVHIRVGTNTYLSADIGGSAGQVINGKSAGNFISGNVHTDVYVESFDSYNPVTKVVPPLPASINAASLTALSTVFLDDTAQLDLRFNNNVGNSVTIVSPFNNFGGNLPGDVSPNGAIYPFDPVKDRVIFNGNSGNPRLVQLFEVDNGNALNQTNSFVSGGITQDLSTSFFSSSWFLRTQADPLFPNPGFPQDFQQSPGNPFLP